ncbi:DUF305 domain-containing protein [Amycolatopsis acidiphila]|uniref:DUF305 domain-containing protein n=1 Tax=Amycolatopsis acidiphila TaxID=715473 RepID=A0A558AAJ1_9PSEU|nr:DUF305 domain-containing protein [Amycolatopsis acidiphila]TVT21262.1 DUF305 domain-containing protein [Amycolatopsis acidiphila]UIJ61281.1 DUF305 domain-containing protein [Amycolatopsis acidiphila]GHG78456.1 DUF305 domain-containing protein [Amycolatopsis acidiphila]
MTEPEEAPAQSSFSRPVVIGAAVVAVLLLGAVLGMFLTQRALNSSEPATPAAGSVEVGFAQDMSVHHLQAVTMANWERDHSTDPQVRQLAFDIQSTQLEQVGRMKGWLMLWGQPEQTTGAYMTWMTQSGGHDMAGMGMPSPGASSSDAPMPGMATNAELTRLRSLSGRDLDVYFLQLMLRHHQGGTAMAQYAHDHTSVAAVKALTQSILDSQGAEIVLMKQMLAARDAQPL